MTVVAPSALNRGTALRALLVVCALFGVLGATSSPASAAVPCWKALLNDWYDGTINNVYPIPCYHQAIDHLPLDVSVYSSARQDIERALQRALAAGRTVTQITPTTPIPNSTTSTSTTTTPTTTTTKKKRSPVSQALRDITPGGPGSFPLPLLILGLLAILLVLAGIGGLVWRRYQGRGGPPASPA